MHIDTAKHFVADRAQYETGRVSILEDVAIAKDLISCLVGAFGHECCSLTSACGIPSIKAKVGLSLLKYLRLMAPTGISR